MRIAWLAFVLLFVGCSENRQFAGECSKNTDCPVGSACKISGAGESGICVCRSDEACGPGEICNTQGICQKRAGCRSNAECDAARFCDISTGDCIDRTQCGTDIHCLPGTVCGPQGVCVEGCRDTGDCALYRVCNRAGTASTALGSCIAGVCGDKSFCAFGERCTSGSCAADPNPNHCKLDCNGNAECGDGGANFCLVNSAYDPNNPAASYETFCGVECDAEEDCPSGYNCGSVVLLTQDQCTNDTECGGEGRRCAMGEGDLRGFCTCKDDLDCAAQYAAPPSCALGSCGGLGIQPCIDDTPCLTTCDFSTTFCQWPQGQQCTDDSQCEPLPWCGPFAGPGMGNVCVTGLPDQIVPCTTDDECLCFQGRCANTGRPCQTGAECNPPCVGGGCFLGNTCAPEEGLLCTDVR